MQTERQRAKVAITIPESGFLYKLYHTKNGRRLLKSGAPESVVGRYSASVSIFDIIAVTVLLPWLPDTPILHS